MDSYAEEAQDFLEREASNIQRLIKAIKDRAVSGESEVKSIIDELVSVARNWDNVAQPIQLSAKARGLDHDPSREIAYSIRSLSIELFNKHGMISQSLRINELLGNLFAELPEIAEKVEEDAETLAKFSRERTEAAAIDSVSPSSAANSFATGLLNEMQHFLGEVGTTRLLSSMAAGRESGANEFVTAYECVPLDTPPKDADIVAFGFLVAQQDLRSLNSTVIDGVKLFLNRLGFSLLWLNANAAAIGKIGRLARAHRKERLRELGIAETIPLFEQKSETKRFFHFAKVWLIPIAFLMLFFAHAVINRSSEVVPKGAKERQAINEPMRCRPFTAAEAKSWNNYPSTGLYHCVGSNGAILNIAEPPAYATIGTQKTGSAAVERAEARPRLGAAKVDRPAKYARPSVSPKGTPWPKKAGYVLGYGKLNTKGYSKVTIENDDNSSDVFVKLYAYSAEGIHPVRHIFVPAHGRFTMNSFSPGKYDVRFKQLDTGLAEKSEPFSLEEHEVEDGINYSDISMTLYKIRDGNMQTYPISDQEF